MTNREFLLKEYGLANWCPNCEKEFINLNKNYENKVLVTIDGELARIGDIELHLCHDCYDDYVDSDKELFNIQFEPKLKKYFHEKGLNGGNRAMS